MTMTWWSARKMKQFTRLRTPSVCRVLRLLRFRWICGGTGRSLDAAALNAGVGLGGPFVENDLTAELDMIDLNVRSTVHLAKRVLGDMVARNEGRVLIKSSIASTMPGRSRRHLLTCPVR